MANISPLHRIEVATVGLLSLGHLAVDLCPLFLAALLPLLTDRLGLFLTLASLLASILMFSASLSQPLFGILLDRIGGKAHVLGAHHGGRGDELHRSPPRLCLASPFIGFGGLAVSGTGALADNLVMERAKGFLWYLPITARLFSPFFFWEKNFPGLTKKP